VLLGGFAELQSRSRLPQAIGERIQNAEAEGKAKGATPTGV
jgi:hypothetical protein